MLIGRRGELAVDLRRNIRNNFILKDSCRRVVGFITNGSLRKYKATTNGTVVSSTETVTGAMKTFEGDIYYEIATKFDDSDIVGKAYVSEENGVYKVRGASLMQGVEVVMEYPDAKKEVGYSWISAASPTGTINNVPARIKTAIKEKVFAIFSVI